MAELTPLEKAELLSQVAAMSDEAYKMEVLAQLRKINGTVADHERTLHGHREQPGLVATVADHEKIVASGKAAIRVMKVMVPLIGVGQLATLWLTLTRLAEVPLP